MFPVISQILEKDKQVYQSGRIAVAGTIFYAIQLNKINDQNFYFHFSYLNRLQAEAISRKLWSEGDKFRQDVNRVKDPQWTMLSMAGE